MQTINNQYGKYYLKPGSKLKDLNNVADALNQVAPNKWTKTLARQAVFSDAAKSTFAKSKGRRLAKLAQTLSTEKLGTGKVAKAAKIATAMAALDLILMANNVAAMDTMPEFNDMMDSYARALDYQLQHGYPHGKYEVDTLVKLRVLAQAVGADSEAFLVIYKSYLERAQAAEQR